MTYYGVSYATEEYRPKMTIVTPDLPSVTLNNEGYATFSCAYPVQVSGAGVYTAKVNGSTLECTKVEDGKVPAYNGVLLFGTANATVTLTHDNTASELAVDNELRPTTTAKGLATTETSLVLNGNTFMKYTGETFAENKAYLPYTDNGSGGSITRISIEGSPTNAAMVQAEDSGNNAPTYNTAGQRVPAGSRGIVISNGKAYINK